MIPIEQVLLFILSLLANGLSALAGGGAGLLQLPALLFLGLEFPSALATHKVASVALGIGATLRHLRGPALEIRLLAVMLASGVPGVILGALAILSVPDQAARILLGMLTCGLGLFSWSRPRLGQLAQPRNRDPRGVLAGAAVLFLIGFLNGSLTSGTGLFVTLWLVYWFGLDYGRATAHTLVLVGLFWNGSGAAALAFQAPIRWDWMPALILGALLGGYLGAHLGQVKGNQLVKRTYEIVTLLVGVSLIVDGISA